MDWIAVRIARLNMPHGSIALGSIEKRHDEEITVPPLLVGIHDRVAVTLHNLASVLDKAFLDHICRKLLQQSAVVVETDCWRKIEASVHMKHGSQSSPKGPSRHSSIARLDLRLTNRIYLR